MSDEKKNEQKVKSMAEFAAELTRRLLASGKFEIAPHGVREIRIKKK